MKRPQTAAPGLETPSNRSARVWTKLTPRQPLQDQPGDDADGCTAGDAGEDQHREVGKHLEIGDQEGGHQDLPQVMSDTACDGDTGDREPAGFLKQNHDQETEERTRHGVSRSENAAKKQAGDQDADDIDRQSVAWTEGIQGHDDHQVSDPQLDAGNSRRERDQKFNVRKNQRQ